MTLPKLHIRDLFWLVLVCACLAGWNAHRRIEAVRDSERRSAEAVKVLAAERDEHIWQWELFARQKPWNAFEAALKGRLTVPNDGIETINEP